MQSDPLRVVEVFLYLLKHLNAVKPFGLGKRKRQFAYSRN